jgi:hypothetical protein
MTEQTAQAESEGVSFTPEETAFFDNKGEVPAAPAEAPKETAPPVEVKPEPDKIEKVVPLKALQEERKQRQEMAARLRDIELQNARYAERFKIVEQQQQPAPPKVGEDPFAYLEKVVPSEIDSVKQKLAQFEQRDILANQQRQVMSNYQADVSRFKAENPDFDQAYKFVADGYLREAQANGLPNPVQAAHSYEMQVVINALRSGASPAERIMSIAKARGFEPKPTKSEADKLATIEKGQAANKSLTAAGGTAGGEAMTAEQLVKMPLDEFEKWCKTHPAQAKRLMGG